MTVWSPQGSVSYADAVKLIGPQRYSSTPASRFTSFPIVVYGTAREAVPPFILEIVAVVEVELRLVPTPASANGSMRPKSRSSRLDQSQVASPAPSPFEESPVGAVTPAVV